MQGAGGAGHSGFHRANLASINASFRAAKPFPYVGLRELHSSGGQGRQAEAKWPHPGARQDSLHRPFMWLSWRGRLTLQGQGWRDRACLALWRGGGGPASGEMGSVY